MVAWGDDLSGLSSQLLPIPTAMALAICPVSRAKLDYIASLGVDAVWISPFFTSPMKDFGYDVADYCDVDPIFGTLADFDVLVAKAHQLGLQGADRSGVSHTSDQHAWFAESRANRIMPKPTGMSGPIPKPDGSPPNNWQSVFHGAAWTWDARRGNITCTIS